MITYLKVNGFRSLINFELRLSPGLNVLVGPNGSGKTNIITFFEFLSNLIVNGPSEAVNSIGGAGSVFSKIGDDEFSNKITVEIQGSSETASKTNKFLDYYYKFCIEASEDFDSIKLTNQELSLFRDDELNFKEFPFEKSFSILKTQTDPDNQNITIKNFSNEYIDGSFYPEKIRNEFSRDEKMFTIYLKDASNTTSDTLLSELSYFIDSVRYILADLRGGKVFNINPSRVKTLEESSNFAGIQKEGSGLAATLYAIKNRKPNAEIPKRTLGPRRVRPQPNIKDTSITRILDYVKIANPAVKKLDVEKDPFDNSLKIFFWIEKGNETTKLPLSAMSDGTIKWLALVTAILTSRSIFSIEEPENFLHPHMQTEIVKLMRNTAFERSSKAVIIISTHSETILNNIKPEEIVIVSFVNGSTKAKRCKNGQDISSEIQKTGFGLGYYYMAGSLDDE